MTQPTDWTEVRAWALARIEEHRDALEAIGLTDAASCVLRGQIAELRALIERGEPKPVRERVPRTIPMTAGPKSY